MRRAEGLPLHFYLPGDMPESKLTLALTFGLGLITFAWSIARGVVAVIEWRARH